MIFVAVVLGLPAFEHDWLVLPHGFRGEAALERGKINERLECRAWLTLRRDGAVVLAFGIALSADHGAHGAFGCHGDDGALGNFKSLSFEGELLVERSFRRRLQNRID